MTKGVIMRSLKKDLTGKRFENIIVVSRAENKNGRVAYLCKCDCGKEFVTLAQHITGGFVKSCGCGNRRKASQRMKSMNTKHGKSGTRLYEIWQNMRRRCNEKNNPCYKNYGARGISFDKSWADFSTFEQWAIDNGYSDDLTIDRIDVNKGYFPENCRWVTRKTQGNNKRTNLYITYHGKTKTLAEWADLTNIPYSKLKYRIYKGWDIEKVFADNDLGCKKVRCIDTGQIFESTASAAKSVNVTQSAISNVCRGVRKQCHGFRWEYI